MCLDICELFKNGRVTGIPWLTQTPAFKRSDLMLENRLHPKNCVHSLHFLSLVVACDWLIYTHILQGYLTATGAATCFSIANEAILKYMGTSWTGIVLGMGSAIEWRHYNVTWSLIGWVHTQNASCMSYGNPLNIILKQTQPQQQQ